MSLLPRTQFEAVPRNSLGQDVSSQLIAAICRRELRGGERLVEAELALRFEVSRTPVREALGELADAGLVEMRLSRGVVVREFGEKQLLDIYQVRGTLEGEATRGATGRIPNAELMAIRNQMHELREQSQGGKSSDWALVAWGADEALHATISAHCGNRRLAEEIHRYNKLVRGVRKAVDNPDGQQELAIVEHITILDCLIAEDAERANRAMRLHIDSAAKVAVETIFSRATGSPG